MRAENTRDFTLDSDLFLDEIYLVTNVYIYLVEIAENSFSETSVNVTLTIQFF